MCLEAPVDMMVFEKISVVILLFQFISFYAEFFISLMAQRVWNLD